MSKDTITITNNRDGKTYEFNTLDASGVNYKDKVI